MSELKVDDNENNKSIKSTMQIDFKMRVTFVTSQIGCL